MTLIIPKNSLLRHYLPLKNFHCLILTLTSTQIRFTLHASLEDMCSGGKRNEPQPSTPGVNLSFTMLSLGALGKWQLYASISSFID